MVHIYNSRITNETTPACIHALRLVLLRAGLYRDVRHEIARQVIQHLSVKFGEAEIMEFPKKWVFASNESVIVNYQPKSEGPIQTFSFRPSAQSFIVSLYGDDMGLFRDSIIYNVSIDKHIFNPVTHTDQWDEWSDPEDSIENYINELSNGNIYIMHANRDKYHFWGEISIYTQRVILWSSMRDQMFTDGPAHQYFKNISKAGQKQTGGHGKCKICGHLISWIEIRLFDALCGNHYVADVPNSA